MTTIILDPHLPVWSCHSARNSHLSVMSRREAELRVIRRALVDSEFRTQLVQDPKGSIELELECSFPSDLQIHLLEDAPFKVHFVLPMKPEANSLLLSTLPYNVIATWTAEQRVNAFASTTGLGDLVERAWTNGDLRSELLRDPQSVLKRELGVGVTSDVVVAFEDRDQIYLVIPWLNQTQDEDASWFNLSLESTAVHFQEVLIASTHHNPNTAQCCTSFGFKPNKLNKVI